MESKIWATSADENIIYKQMTKSFLAEALNLIKKQFFYEENLSIALGLSTDQQAIDEVIKLIEMSAYDGVSVVAVDKKTNKVAGAVFNKIQFLNPKEKSCYETFVDNSQNTKSKDYVQFVIDFDNSCNLFELCETDCLMELTFLIVDSDYKNRGIGKQLFKTSLEIGASLKNGINVKIPIDNTNLSLEPIPKVACAVLSSPYSQKIVHALQFEIPLKKKIDEFEYNGKNFKLSIGKTIEDFELAYKIL